MSGLMQKVSALTSSSIGNYLTNQQTWGGVILNVKSYGAKGDEVAVDTAAVQAAIDAAAVNTNTSGLNKNVNIGGIVYFPPGKYKIGKLIMRSNVRIIGAGMFVSIIQPINTDGSHIFGAEGLTTSNDMMAHVQISNISISPTGNWWGDSETKQNVKGFDFRYSVNVLMENVMIDNISGTVLDLPWCMDSVFRNVWIWACGDGGLTPSILLDRAYRTVNGVEQSELSNALKFESIHVEKCPYMLKVGGASRQNQFTACKFEWALQNSDVSGAAILLDSSLSTQFSNCMFVTGVDDYPLIKLNVSVADSFDGCSYSSPNPGTGWFFDCTTNVTSVSITGGGCTEYGTAKFLSGGRNLTLSHVSFFRSGKNGVIFIDLVEECIVDDCIFNRLQGDATTTIIRMNKFNKADGNRFMVESGKTPNIFNVTFVDNVISKNKQEGTGLVFLLVKDGATGNHIANNYNDGSITWETTMRDWNFYENKYGSFVSPVALNEKGAMTFSNSRLTLHDGSSEIPLNMGQSGTTVQRPTLGLYSGKPYWDTTLGKPIFYDAAAVAWKDATGTVV